MKKKKTCSFYVSEYHLATMLMPYISEKLNENIKVITFLEKEMEENINKIVKNININELKKEKVKSINWKENKAYNYLNFKRNMIEKDTVNIIIAGSEKHIDIINTNINRYLLEKTTINQVIINNCYDVSIKNVNIKNILDNHDKILNTSGEREIIEVFEDYKTKEHKIISS